jgi:FKBP-type peptidyl-prolyl cis-trans isomerase FkpA
LRPITRTILGIAAMALAGSMAFAGAMEEYKKSQAFLKSAAAEPGAVKTSSGLIMKVLTPGTGESPKLTDTVKVNFTGTLIDGTEFDSAARHGEPPELRVDKVIKCWTEGLQKMKVGEKAQLVCPSAIAYADKGLPPMVPPGAVLVFQLELLAIVK